MAGRAGKLSPEAGAVLERLRKQRELIVGAGETEPVLRIDAAGAGVQPRELSAALAELSAAGVVELLGKAASELRTGLIGGESAPGLCRLEEAGSVYLVRLTEEGMGGCIWSA